MSFASFKQIQWPEATKIVRRKRKNPTITFIQTLFNNTGIISSVAYFILLSVIQPLLSEQFIQRGDLSSSILLRVRNLVISLQKRIRTTPITVLGYNEKGNYIERCTQTEPEDEITVVNKGTSVWTAFKERLEEINEDLDTFNELYHNKSSSSMDDFNFQTKLLTDQIILSDNTNNITAKTKDITNSVREMKGWFVSGNIL